MDSTSSASYWIAGIIVVLAIILGAWLIASNNNSSVGVPNTGAPTNTVTPTNSVSPTTNNSGTTNTNTGTGAGTGTNY